MNDCERILPLLSALMDGELAEDESRDTLSHLQSCDACRNEWQTLQELDAKLKQSLVVFDWESKSSAIAHPPEVRTVRATAGWQLKHWASALIAVAAVLMIAVLPSVFKSVNDKSTVSPELAAVARLVRATGPVQLLSPGASDWTDVSADSHDSLFAGSRLKTSNDVVCEFETSTSGIIRLNKSAEMVLRNPNQVELLSGQLWCFAPNDSGIDVDVFVNSAESSEIAVFSCPSASEIQCESTNDRWCYNSVSAANAQARITIGDFSCEVAPGETVSIDSANQVDRSQNTDSATKVWQLPLLTMDGRATRELLSLLNHVLAPIGMTKAMHLNEQQIRQLGPAGAIPLLAYAATESSPERLALRQTAIRLAADLADENAIELLESLQTDNDAFIAEVAKKALARIANRQG
jgi:hypothetical protein